MKRKNCLKPSLFIVTFIILVLVLIIMGIFSFFGNGTKGISVSGAKGIIFPESYNLSFMLKEKRYTPSEDDIKKAEEILGKFVKENASNVYSRFSNYNRQYFGLINENNEKIIYINAGIGFDRFDKPNWKKSLVHVDDGGDSFFNARINLKTEKCFSFSVNGEA